MTVRSHHKKGYLKARSTSMRSIGFTEAKCGQYKERKLQTRKMRKCDKVAHKMRQLGESEIARILEMF